MFIFDILISCQDGQKEFVGAGYLHQVYLSGRGESWFNRLVFDAGQPEGLRKTWTIKGPSQEAALRESGLIGPVLLYTL